MFPANSNKVTLTLSTCSWEPYKGHQNATFSTEEQHNDLVLSRSTCEGVIMPRIVQKKVTLMNTCISFPLQIQILNPKQLWSAAKHNSST